MIRVVLIYVEGRASADAAAERVWRQRLLLSFATTLRRFRMPFLRFVLFDRAEVPDEMTAIIDRVAALEDGDPRVLYETALRVRDGDGWPRDLDAAAEWMGIAGESGITDAAYDASQILLDPSRSSIDRTSGIRLLGDAGYAGHVGAQLEVARRFTTSDQIDRWDYAAYLWFSFAAQNGADVQADLDRIWARLSVGNRLAAERAVSEGLAEAPRAYLSAVDD